MLSKGQDGTLTPLQQRWLAVGLLVIGSSYSAGLYLIISGIQFHRIRFKEAI